MPALPNATIAYETADDPHRCLEITREDGEFAAYVHGLRRFGCLSLVAANRDSASFDTAAECVAALADLGLVVDRPELLDELLESVTDSGSRWT